MEVRRVIPPDTIPSIDDPEFGSEYLGEGDEDVLVFAHDGDARAYPVRILNYHEIVNDEVGGRPVAVTWCPLCGSGIVYDRTVDGRALEFGVSGKLADDDLVMYDRQTESEWKQSLGRAIDGPLAGTDLDALPAAMTTLARFRESHPDGLVLQPPGGESEAASDDDTPAPIDYERGPYEGYVDGEGFGLDAHRGQGGRNWDRTDLAPKDVVLGVEHGDDALGFPRRAVLDAGGVATASVGGRPVVVFATPDGTHAFVDPGYEWGATDAGDARFGADGTRWDGSTGESEDGRRLDRVAAKRLFAFAWQDDHGPDAFWSV